MIDRELRTRRRTAVAEPEDPSSHLRLGLALRRTGDLEAARSAFVRAIELAPRREAPRAALREVLAEIAARDLPGADGLLGGYAVRRLLRTVPDEAPLRTFLASDLKKLRRVVLRLRSYVGGRHGGRAPADGFERLAVRLGPARELRHPNVVRTIDFQRLVVEGNGPAREHHLLAVEARSEPTLDRLIALGPMEPRRVASILRQVLLACEAAHRRGLVHRLLSPRKIHVGPPAGAAETESPHEHVRVRDFGLALFLGAPGKGQGLLGTAVLAYAPPEVLVAGPCDERADLYAVGAIAYALLAGAPPFRGDSPRERLRSILAQTPEGLPRSIARSLPPGLEALVMRLLAREPDARPRTARAAIDALDACVPEGQRPAT